MLQLFQSSENEEPHAARWGWLVLALGLMASAAFFLYPSLVSFTEPPRTVAPPAPIPAAAPAQPPVKPEPTPVKPEPTPVRPEPKPVKPIGRTIQPAKPIRQVVPAAPEGIRNRIAGEIPINVSVHIGRDGRVTSARLVSPAAGGGVQSYLAQRALEAVRQWKFRPARLGGEAVPGQLTIHFRFRRSGTKWN